MIPVTADLLQKKDHSLTGPLTVNFNFLITLICHLVVQCQSQPSFCLITLLIFLIAQRIFDTEENWSSQQRRKGMLLGRVDGHSGQEKKERMGLPHSMEVETTGNTGIGKIRGLLS